MIKAYYCLLEILLLLYSKLQVGAAAQEVTNFKPGMFQASKVIQGQHMSWSLDEEELSTPSSRRNNSISERLPSALICNSYEFKTLSLVWK